MFEAYRIPLLIGTGLLLTTAFYFAYRPNKACGPDGSCSTPNRRVVKMNCILLWTTTVVVVGFASFPSWMHLVVGPGEAATATAATETSEVRCAVEGMHCEGCKGLLQTELMKIPSVITAAVSYDEKLAVVSIRNDAHLSHDAVTKAGQEVGFEVRPSQEQ